ncbi:hypothetical protein [Pseudoalteromonas luteoviolacea]|uniref:Uncharacterized protein n=1 Tax=Pseudoalteromonas luteoviolacea S4054 TaxID=1129367 RepID=A0A0F6A7D2_9GAMM|nr:hypothetical protein [Pseudoalteromonas luteoviolacea]AOT10703.1 hypothetical protein S4054249_22875 [Pseudoalteromonas luteoviolacea]AOT16135.1 hypothetical protein S40542_25635 [Pseudoalteromonas luteoviolacea]AOT20523.1 hypothetical protein S4054_22790 [Pseudoalteromonas luteoviolacea]KKE82075.1 hypothetical protein N479_20200 [Pseudoalteromonas luteoviolacea S4054]KZN67706.1 hypothetical protein N481_23715 [Pseudoalteromonas luteoviolacea S4047-1]
MPCIDSEINQEKNRAKQWIFNNSAQFKILSEQALLAEIEKVTLPSKEAVSMEKVLVLGATNHATLIEEMLQELHKQAKKALFFDIGTASCIYDLLYLTKIGQQRFLHCEFCKDQLDELRSFIEEDIARIKFQNVQSDPLPSELVEIKQKVSFSEHSVRTQLKKLFWPENRNSFVLSNHTTGDINTPAVRAYKNKVTSDPLAQTTQGALSFLEMAITHCCERFLSNNGNRLKANMRVFRVDVKHQQFDDSGSVKKRRSISPTVTTRLWKHEARKGIELFICEQLSSMPNGRYDIVYAHCYLEFNQSQKLLTQFYRPNKLWKRLHALLTQQLYYSVLNEMKAFTPYIITTESLDDIYTVLESNKVLTSKELESVLLKLQLDRGMAGDTELHLWTLILNQGNFNWQNHMPILIQLFDSLTGCDPEERTQLLENILNILPTTPTLTEIRLLNQIVMQLGLNDAEPHFTFCNMMLNLIGNQAVPDDVYSELALIYNKVETLSNLDAIHSYLLSKVTDKKQLSEGYKTIQPICIQLFKLSFIEKFEKLTFVDKLAVPIIDQIDTQLNHSGYSVESIRPILKAMIEFNQCKNPPSSNFVFSTLNLLLKYDVAPYSKEMLNIWKVALKDSFDCDDKYVYQVSGLLFKFFIYQESNRNDILEHISESIFEGINKDVLIKSIISTIKHHLKSCDYDQSAWSRCMAGLSYLIKKLNIENLVSETIKSSYEHKFYEYDLVDSWFEFIETAFICNDNTTFAKSWKRLQLKLLAARNEQGESIPDLPM